MNTRPRSVTVIGWLFIAVGIFGFAYHASEIKGLELEHLWTLCVRLLAVVGGVFLLRGANWARALLLLWLAYHVILSVMHSTIEFATHAVLFAVIAYLLLQTRATRYFQGGAPGTEGERTK